MYRPPVSSRNTCPPNPDSRRPPRPGGRRTSAGSCCRNFCGSWLLASRAYSSRSGLLTTMIRCRYQELDSGPIPRRRGESRANSSLSQIPLLAGKIQGISSIRNSAARQRGPKKPSNQCLTSQFPTLRNREFFAALQGIKSDDQGSFSPHQGIRSRPLFWYLL